MVTCSLLFVVLILLAAIGSFFRYPGSPLILAAFHIAFVALMAMTVYHPRINAYLFLTGFMVLGFWLKFLLHIYFNYPFVEPVGDFDYSPAQWDVALSASAAAAAGVALFRLQHLAVPRRRVPDMERLRGAPGWYRRHAIEIWITALAGTLVLHLLNYRYAFFQTGVNPRLELPAGLNAALAWSVYAGVPLTWSLLFEWELTHRPGRFLPQMWVTCLLAIVSSASMASRATAIFLFAAYGVALMVHMPAVAGQLFRGRWWRLGLVLTGTLALSLFIASVVRMNLYVVESKRLTRAEVFRQVLTLPVGRWVGLEGVLSVSGSQERGLPLLMDGLVENPESGVDSIYQGLSRSPYEYESDFIYLTLPGAPAILFYSGSILIVLMGMYFLMTVSAMVEMFALRVTGSRFLATMLGLLLANAIAEMSFPYLWMAFLAQTIFALWLFAGLRVLASSIEGMRRGLRTDKAEVAEG